MEAGERGEMTTRILGGHGAHGVEREGARLLAVVRHGGVGPRVREAGVVGDASGLAGALGGDDPGAAIVLIAEDE